MIKISLIIIIHNNIIVGKAAIHVIQIILNYVTHVPLVIIIIITNIVKNVWQAANIVLISLHVWAVHCIIMYWLIILVLNVVTIVSGVYYLKTTKPKYNANNAEKATFTITTHQNVNHCYHSIQHAGNYQKFQIQQTSHNLYNFLH